MSLTQDSLSNTFEEAALREAIRSLDVATKVRLVAGASTWMTGEESRIGLQPLTVSDGPVGVRGSKEDEREWSANFPSPSALAATWDETVLEQIGEALASEAVRKDVDVVLGPTINLHRTPYGGRHFECLSEDPYLTGRLATAYVRGLQENGIGACPKHFVANDSETERHTLNAVVDEKTLREVYLAPFEQVVTQAKPWMIMSAYNAVNGHFMTESPLLEDPLKTEWGFDGVVVSDWEAVYSTDRSATAALDLAMPGPEKHWGSLLEEAIAEGRVPESALDEKIVRLALLAHRAGKFEGSTGVAPKPTPKSLDELDSIARRTAAQTMVLLSNKKNSLPLRIEDDTTSVAIIGPGSLDGRPQGGGSATVFAPHVSSPYVGLSEALNGKADVRQATGVALAHGLRPIRSFEMDDAVIVQWLDDENKIVLEEQATSATLLRAPDSIPAGATHVRVRLMFKAPETGTWRIGYMGVGSFSLEIDGESVFTESSERAPQDIAAALFDRPIGAVEKQLEQGQEIDLQLEFSWAPNFLIFKVDLGVESPAKSEEEEFEHAVAVARESDIAVVVVGTTSMIESEGFDRNTLALPGRQNELVEAVAAVNPHTIVVVNAGSPVAMPWKSRVSAVLVSWFPGMQFGHALADVLLGDSEPGGRLPTTWADDDNGVLVTTTQPTEGTLTYAEGMHIGYRAYLKEEIEPAFWIGAGEGYTTFEEGPATVKTSVDGTVLVTVPVTNTGNREGKHLLQAYLSREVSVTERPCRWLAGFTTVVVPPGETTHAVIVIETDRFRHWDSEIHGWLEESGKYGVHVGRTLGAIRSTLTVQR